MSIGYGCFRPVLDVMAVVQLSCVVSVITAPDPTQKNTTRSRVLAQFFFISLRGTSSNKWVNIMNQCTITFHWLVHETRSVDNTGLHCESKNTHRGHQQKPLLKIKFTLYSCAILIIIILYFGNSLTFNHARLCQQHQKVDEVFCSWKYTTKPFILDKYLCRILYTTRYTCR